MEESSGRPPMGGVARRRRERRLRSMLRHEQQSIRMALATVMHHSFKVHTEYGAPRSQTTATRAREGEVREQHYGLRAQKRPLPGMRPALLVEVQPQGCVERHIVEDPSELAPMVQILDAPVPQMVDSVLEFFRRLDLPVAEQVIDVPMISSSSSCPSRAALSEPLMVEQLVEVPTIISYSSLPRSGVDIPVPGGGGPRSGLHGFLPRQRSTASPSSTERISERIVEQIVDHSSEERISERIVETSAFPSSKKRSSERILEQITVPSSDERSSQRIVEQLVDISSGGLSHGVFSASSAGAADEGPAGRDSGMGKARFAGEVAPRALSSRGKAVFVDSCEFFIEFDGKWESQGHGIAKLIQHSSGSQIFQFWQNKQIWYDDVIRRVGADVLVLKPVGRSGRTLSWMDPDFAGGEYWHAARFPSPELARRFYAVWMGSG